MKFSDEQAIYRATESFFVNTKALVVYYYDVLNIPWFTYLSMIRSQPRFGEILDIDLLNTMSIEELLFWYMAVRKQFNPLKDLWKGGKCEEEEMDSFLFSEMAREDCMIFHQTEYPFLTIPNALEQIIHEKFCEKIYVYSEVKDPNIEKVIHAKYGEDIIILYGDLMTHMSLFPQETTYIFSRFEIIDTLLELNRLDYSAILLPYDFRYNMNEDKTSYKHDLEKLQKDHVVKIAMYNTIRE